jgi:transcription elongation factor Elf1
MRKCPFCGDNNIAVSWVDYGYRAHCLTCEAMGPRHAPAHETEEENEAATERAKTAWEARS